MAKETFDLIVVGAGPAGLTAAYVAAKAGLKVIVFERGEYPGSKNMMGGILFSRAMNEIIPEFWKEAPLERPISEMRYWLLSSDCGVTFSFKNKNFLKEPYNSFSALRAKFDRWFGQKVEETGALLVCETVVEKLIQQDGKVIGVQTGREEGDVYGSVVIVADGVNSLLTRDIGFHEEWRGDQVGLGVKELITLPKETIENRFNIEGKEGVAIEMFGAITKGMTGGGFIYTNLDSISIGVVTMVDDLNSFDVCPADLMEELKVHPLIKPLIEGGETKEYTAHLVPEGGYNAVPKLYSNGLLVVGDAAMLVNSPRGEGTNLAISSGKYAAEAVIEAKNKGDFSAATLSSYEKKLNNSFIMKDLKKYKDTYPYLHTNRAMLGLYPDLVTSVLSDVFTVDGIPKTERMREIKKKIRAKRSYWKIGTDLFKGWRAIR